MTLIAQKIHYQDSLQIPRPTKTTYENRQLKIQPVPVTVTNCFLLGVLALFLSNIKKYAPNTVKVANPLILHERQSCLRVPCFSSFNCIFLKKERCIYVIRSFPSGNYHLWPIHRSSQVLFIISKVNCVVSEKKKLLQQQLQQSDKPSPTKSSKPPG